MASVTVNKRLHLHVLFLLQWGNFASLYTRCVPPLPCLLLTLSLSLPSSTVLHTRILLFLLSVFPFLSSTPLLVHLLPFCLAVHYPFSISFPFLPKYLALRLMTAEKGQEFCQLRRNRTDLVYCESRALCIQKAHAR